MLKRCVLTALVVLAPACRGAPSPSETIDLLVEAVRERDSVRVAQYIDVQRVAQSAVDPLFRAAAAMEMSDPDRFRSQTGGMGVEMLEQFRPMIAPMMEQMFWQMLLRPESLQQGPIGQMLGDQPLPLAELGDTYQGVIDERRDGDDAIVSVQLSHDTADRAVVIDMRLEETEEGWRVVSFENLQDAISKIVEESSP